MGYRENFFEANESGAGGWYSCGECGKSLRKDEVTVDHIVPQSKGGSDSAWNLQALCRPCNSRKKDKVGKDTVKGFLNKLLK